MPSGPDPGFETTDGAFSVVVGAPGGADLPAVADDDGDGRADIAVTGPWTIRRGTDGPDESIAFGPTGSDFAAYPAPV